VAGEVTANQDTQGVTADVAVCCTYNVSTTHHEAQHHLMDAPADGTEGGMVTCHYWSAVHHHQPTLYSLATFTQE
jgi:hypothetical protein